MKHYLPLINPKKEIDTIVQFLQKTLIKQCIENVVIGLSGGVDSTTSLYLLRKVLPSKNIYVAHLYYFKPQLYLIKVILNNLKIPGENFISFTIKKPVDEFKKLLTINQQIDKIRLGNLMARTRMIILYDLAKKYKALVCGTENKSEHLLGYFTRFGDEASDIEPIRHLYKTQIYQLAEYLKVPQEVIDQAPTAGFWSGQTDEKEFGFTYEEADQVLYLYFDKQLSLKTIQKKGFSNAKIIINKIKFNEFKHNTPYFLSK